MIERTLFKARPRGLAMAFAVSWIKEIAPRHAQWEEPGYVDRSVWSKLP